MRAGSREPALGPASRALRGGCYPAIEDYAAIGDGRTLALIRRDGVIDWLCLPNLDSPSVFAGILDRSAGGTCALTPATSFEAERRYLDNTNILETTFRTGGGTVRVTDALTLPNDGLTPGRELVRRIEGLAGEVPMRWSVAPRFGYATRPTRIDGRLGVPVATSRSDAMAVSSWEAGPPRIRRDRIDGGFRASQRSDALLVLSAAHGEPLVLPSRKDVESRLGATTDYWVDWVGRLRYEGPWRDAVVRSALALKLLTFAPSGAIAAAGTTSLPEAPGGERNWDYRYSWVRDSTFTLDALVRLGCSSEATSFFWWLLHASQLTHPNLRVLYGLNGQSRAPERELPLTGYRHSSPVRVGNEAAGQLQLDVFGHLLATASLYSDSGGHLDRDTSKRLAATADLVCGLWREPDSGIWEVRGEPRHYTESKMLCWVTLDRALALAQGGHIVSRHADVWVREREAIRFFIEERCWSDDLRSYVRSEGEATVDASLLLGVLMGYPGRPGRLAATTDRVVEVLGRGPLVHRYLAADGLPGEEGAFLPCSFWLVDALARLGRVEEAERLMTELVGLGNDVGLYAEEIDPDTGEFLGNFPQGLVHLALINAAVSLSDA